MKQQKKQYGLLTKVKAKALFEEEIEAIHIKNRKIILRTKIKIKEVNHLNDISI